MSSNPIERKGYAQRRELFKDIWNATMLFDDNGDATADAKVKPKIIKTQRLERSSNVKTSIRKKRLKNLRTVCNKILAFCDHQEEDSLFSGQIVSGGYANKSLPNQYSITKKKKIVKKAKKSLSSTKENALLKSTVSEKKDRNIIGGNVVVPVDSTRKWVKRAVPMVKGAVPQVASQMRSKLTSTRSPLRNSSSPSPTIRQKLVIKKSSTKKKKSADI